MTTLRGLCMYLMNKWDLCPECRPPWEFGLTDYSIEEHVRDCEKCQAWQTLGVKFNADTP